MTIQTFTNTNTTTGRTAHTGVYVAIGLIVLAVAQTIVQFPSYFHITWQGYSLVEIASIVAAFLANYFNKNVPNK